ncbi:integrase [Cryobacterium sp. MP_M5]|uniref:tyrosine-type recombinase/integrase n=1 Tax=unclassified Cryobacterium TaxID=2649013 RepID=UPI0018C9B474|nr:MULTISPECIES: site-specific integrase [unclassified Cryobacterium]MBG6059694.1 integrase [Cryobacterium sp. MP_M3]MEC5178066.1 integrase [Cryobacterium sp. MP_M5]
MVRPQITAGELGKIDVKRLPSGRYRARASSRDDSGALNRLTVTAETEDAARDEVIRQATATATGGSGALSPSSTIAEAVELWLSQILTRAKAGSLAYSTYESYETTARVIIVPRCGGVRLDRLTVGRCDRVLQRILEEETISKARRARAVLSLVCGYAVRDDALERNPVRDVQRLPTSPKKESALTREQIKGIRELMQQWRVTREDGPRPNYRALIDGMDIMLGTSVRIGECLGLRRCDVDITAEPPTLTVNGTIVSNKAQGSHRKDSPKRSRQRRSIALPSLAAAAVRRRLALAEPEPEAFLFPTRTGRSLSVSNYERLLRIFVGDEGANLIELGVDVDEYTTHIYRRTAATLIERAAGITLASRLLGHANEQTTRNSYVVTADQVDPVTAEILDAVLGG